MKHVPYLIALSALFTSCATIINQPHETVTIYTTEPGVIIFEKDTIETVRNRALLSAERKNEPLRFTAVTGGGRTKTVEVRAQNSFMYWSNILNYGIGMLVDRKNPKRYAYPRRVFLNSSDTVRRYYRYPQGDNKGEMYLHVSLPHINSFQLNPLDEGTKTNTGFWGLTVGIDYYHSTNQFISVSASGVADLFVPVPAAVDISGEYELMSSRYVSLSNNHRIRRFTLGYGFSYARNTWDFRYYDRFSPSPPSRNPVKKSHYSIGFIFPTYFQSGKNFRLGVVYRPGFFRPFMHDKLRYEHLISVDLAWKIRLNNSFDN